MSIALKTINEMGVGLQGSIHVTTAASDMIEVADNAESKTVYIMSDNSYIVEEVKYREYWGGSNYDSLLESVWSIGWARTKSSHYQ